MTTTLTDATSDKKAAAALAKETAATASYTNTRRKPTTASDHLQVEKPFDKKARLAESYANELLAAWCEYGTDASYLAPELFPTPRHRQIAEIVIQATFEGERGWPAICGRTLHDEQLRQSFMEAVQERPFPTTPAAAKPLSDYLRGFYVEKHRLEVGQKIARRIEAGEDWKDLRQQLDAVEAIQDSHNTRSLVTYGCLEYPTDIPPESVILGNGWVRQGDIVTFISTAGAGKSVAVTQAAFAWGLGLPCLGIQPPRPLRILLFSGEDDGVTLGQCREGLLEHSREITGRKLSAKDLEPLNRNLRTEFCREHVGEGFHAHLDSLLRAEPCDLVIVNPLLSYLGGEVVACVSSWLRAGLMPILQRHGCAALVASHTPKLAKDGWDNTDDVYSAIGGGEMANIPRAVLCLRPTPAEGLCVLKVGKRTTTGWKDDDGVFVSQYFVRRTSNPERPAWIPVGTEQAADLIGERKTNGNTSRRKVTPEDVVAAVATGAMQRQALIEWLMRKGGGCSDTLAKQAIREAEQDLELIASYTETNPRGGHPLRWFCLPEHLPNGKQ